MASGNRPQGMAEGLWKTYVSGAESNGVAHALAGLPRRGMHEEGSELDVAWKRGYDRQVQEKRPVKPAVPR